MDAPLSSPSLGHAPKHQQQHQHSYFTRSSSSSTSTSSSSNYSSGDPAAASAYPSSYTTSTTTTHAQQQSTQSLQQRADATSPFLKDFNLVAEAAKRAQMACLMRDLEGVGISGS